MSKDDYGVFFCPPGPVQSRDVSVSLVNNPMWITDAESDVCGVCGKFVGNNRRYEHGIGLVHRGCKGKVVCLQTHRESVSAG